MFKKLKDKLAEEVKSSPQRIQQFAQAAQAAVTSASSSISDITNNDLFSIGGDDSPAKPLSLGTTSTPSNMQEMHNPLNSLEVSLDRDVTPTNDHSDSNRSRRLSVSSIASDVSFRLPSFESTPMYHLQSDIDVSASEAEERALSSPVGGANLERIPKEQLYAAYRRTRERYTKYRNRYTELAKHYKLLERDNNKARNVLVETQDKALRRISELREQCALEQSAKAHLESALRVDIDEKNMIIQSLNTKIKLLQTFSDSNKPNDGSSHNTPNSDSMESAPQILVDLLTEMPKSEPVDNMPSSTISSEIDATNNKIQKMEQLLNKYKESLKTMKEKNSQTATELQIVSNELKKKIKENESYEEKLIAMEAVDQQYKKTKDLNESLQEKLNSYEEMKKKELSEIQLELHQAKSEILELKSKIDVFSKKEEENAISLAENKLSIHKELENKENEIKRLTEQLAFSTNDIKQLKNKLEDFKTTAIKLEQENLKFKNVINNLESVKTEKEDLEKVLKDKEHEIDLLEQKKAKFIEDYNNLQLQFKQETAEKLASIDRNNYLESRNRQLTDDLSKRNKQILELEKETANKVEIQKKRKQSNSEQLNQELEEWKSKYMQLESEIKDERDELVNLQSEIEKLLANYESLQDKNAELNEKITDLSSNIALEKEEKEKSKEYLRQMGNKNMTLLQYLRDNLSDSYSLVLSSRKSIVDDIMHEVQNNFSKIEETMKTSSDQQIYKLNLTIKENAKLVAEMAKLKDEYDKCKKNNEELIQKLNSFESELSKLEVLENEIDSLTVEKTLLMSEKTKLEEVLEVAKTENNLIKGKADEVLKNVRLLEIELCKIQESHNSLETENKELIAKINLIESNENSEKNNLEGILKEKVDLTILTQNMQAKLDEIQSQKETLDERLFMAQEELLSKEISLKEYASNKETWQQKLAHILDENNLLHEKCERLKQEKEIIHEKSVALEQKLSDSNQKLVSLEESLVENEFLNLRVTQLENDLQLAKSDNFKIQKEIQELLGSKNEAFNTVNKLQNDLSSIANENTIKITDLKKENTSLNDRIKTIQDTLQEKNMLQIKHTEEVENLKHTHSRLLSEIQKLEATIEAQDIEIKQFKSSADENHSLSAKLVTMESKYQSILEEYESLKLEKARLNSDLEGLQTHLAKVSKDNSQLNDKIREMIAYDLNEDNNGDSIIPKLNIEIETLKDSLKSQNDKIEDLERQNTLLYEEKLELEDQLKSQVKSDVTLSHVKANTEKDLELMRIQEKCKDLLEVKSQLESKVADMELLSRNGDGNTKQLEHKNEKLRLANEKLERKLDEALVSLRHMRALEENTELEYLRNILYEYLTGPNTHALTLAKVLAAVVKFDDRQTQLILQREKERQGLLGQLGLL